MRFIIEIDSPEASGYKDAPMDVFKEVMQAIRNYLPGRPDVRFVIEDTHPHAGDAATTDGAD